MVTIILMFVLSWGSSVNGYIPYGPPPPHPMHPIEIVPPGPVILSPGPFLHKRPHYFRPVHFVPSQVVPMLNSPHHRMLSRYEVYPRRDQHLRNDNFHNRRKRLIILRRQHTSQKLHRMNKMRRMAAMRNMAPQRGNGFQQQRGFQSAAMFQQNRGNTWRGMQGVRVNSNGHGRSRIGSGAFAARSQMQNRGMLQRRPAGAFNQPRLKEVVNSNNLNRFPIENKLTNRRPRIRRPKISGNTLDFTNDNPSEIHSVTNTAQIAGLSKGIGILSATQPKPTVKKTQTNSLKAKSGKGVSSIAKDVTLPSKKGNVDVINTKQKAIKKSPSNILSAKEVLPSKKNVKVDQLAVRKKKTGIPNKIVESTKTERKSVSKAMKKTPTKVAKRKSVSKTMKKTPTKEAKRLSVSKTKKKTPTKGTERMSASKAMKKTLTKETKRISQSKARKKSPIKETEVQLETKSQIIHKTAGSVIQSSERTKSPGTETIIPKQKLVVSDNNPRAKVKFDGAGRLTEIVNLSPFITAGHAVDIVTGVVPEGSTGNTKKGDSKKTFATVAQAENPIPTAEAIKATSSENKNADIGNGNTLASASISRDLLGTSDIIPLAKNSILGTNSINMNSGASILDLAATDGALPDSLSHIGHVDFVTVDSQVFANVERAIKAGKPINPDLLTNIIQSAGTNLHTEKATHADTEIIIIDTNSEDLNTETFALLSSGHEMKDSHPTGNTEEHDMPSHSMSQAENLLGGAHHAFHDVVGTVGDSVGSIAVDGTNEILGLFSVQAGKEFPNVPASVSSIPESIGKMLNKHKKKALTKRTGKSTTSKKS